jgi:HAD superfamily phosphatase
MKPLLVFDMDGVLVDVTESYRETIAQTVERFTGV